ncbi:Asp-tRNA(Asn)/Glu-tRNA(Gln) amidotransferase subunit GatC [bacterium]|nr:Asp-tRNA(Asn)/Glu-tRNA(Gln) amidotransferase subunit GatC [bacterium]MCK4436413.1 Asp-tRNA(Asn)/Glu-tRNA(Gln) amidotransferase subunit GatC [bacterium]
MKISKKDVEHVAKLARLRLAEEEKEKFGKQLSEILEYVKKLNELDTEKVEPTSHVVPLKNVMREDEVRPSLPVEDVLRNAPVREGKYFKVPKIIQ